MCSRFRHEFIKSQPHLKIKKCQDYTLKKVITYSSVIRQKLSYNKTLKDFRVFLKSKHYLTFLYRPNVKKATNGFLKIWAHQCECLLAQRLRRCQQMFTLYSSWWEEHALKEFIHNMRQNLSKRGKEFALGTIGLSSYNWEQNRIPETEITKYRGEFEYVELLLENTICLSCDKQSNNNTRLCKCGTSGDVPNKTYDEWTPFIEKQDLIVWRRLHPSGQYEYKVFGSYSDVTAEDFLNVQVDTQYRRKWDNTAVMLEVGERDPMQNGNGDILYWEMLWPRLFVNRDYVFVRRYIVDSTTNTCYIMSKSTEHPKYPKYPEKYRIENYWSIMVIRPYTDMKKPGIQFSLTYFDNPGINIPSSVTNWVAKSVMPDFLERLRKAALEYRQYCVNEGSSDACLLIAKEERLAAEKRERERLDYCSLEVDNETAMDLKMKIKHFEETQKFQLELSESGNSVEDKNETSNWRSFWEYFYLL